MKKCYENVNDQSIISDPLFQRLFRLFLLFAEPINESILNTPTTINNKNRSLQCITNAQAHFIINELFHLMKPRILTCLNIPQQNENVTFRELIELCDIIFPDRKQLEPVVDRVFDRYVSQIVHKGFLMCRKMSSKFLCKKMKNKKWKTYWCTLVPGTIFLWPLHKKINISNRITIVLNSNSTVHMGQFQEDRFMWELYTSKNKYQFSHFDEIQRQHWISDMNLVIEYTTKTELYNFDSEMSKKRENMGKEDYSWKLALEAENHRLTQLIQEERQALHDEEIVRELATRMYDEEKQKNEIFEKQLIDLQKIIHNQQFPSQMSHELTNELSVECMTPTTITLEESIASDEIYRNTFDNYKEDDNETMVNSNQISCLIMSTQSI